MAGSVMFTNLYMARGTHWVNVYHHPNGKDVRYGRPHSSKKDAAIYSGMLNPPIYRIKVTLKCG